MKVPTEHRFHLTPGSVFTLTAFVFVALILWLSTGYPPRARYVPQVIAIFSLICLAFQFALDSFPGLESLFRKVKREEPFSVEGQVRGARGGDNTVLQLEMTAYLWLAGLLGSLLLFGFLVSIPFYILFYLRFRAQMGWFKSALYGAGTWLFVDLLFVRLFEIRLYPGFVLEKFFGF
ncbi:MAG: hypothetical protein ACE5HC_07090 [Candidatus Binatia bacterium]